MTKLADTTKTKTRTFTLEPLGPFSLARASDVMARFPPYAHQPTSVTLPNGELVVRLGFLLDGELRSVAVTLRARPDTRTIRGEVIGTPRVDVAKKQVERIFGLDVDATEYPAIAKRDPKIAPLMKRFEGLRPVSFTSPYECACWAVISQRITKTQAARIVAELVRAHGEKLRVATLGEPGFTDDREIGVFPRPDRLLDVRSVPSLPATKLQRLHRIAEAALDGKLDAVAIRDRGPIEGPKSLLELPGIGPFWASGIYLRASGVVDVFADEPLSIAALGQLHGLGDQPSMSDVARLTERYAPFRMWICFLLRVASSRGAPVTTRRSPSRRPGLHAASPRSRALREVGSQA